ncbi:MAG: helix-turn-helix domain-containing protein [Congregibacter sp.]
MEKGVPIRAISRGLRMLQAINESGSITMMNAARAVEVPYPTACRIMQTLMYEGFVEMEPNRKRYRPTALVHTLSSGHQFENTLVVTARPYLVNLTREVLWPVSIATRVGLSMVVRDSTHSMTSLTFQNYHPGDALPLYSTASGKVHFAFCDEVEREAIVKGLKAFGESDDRALAYFSDTIEQARAARKFGYATHDRNKYTDTPGKTSSLSVPINIGDKFVATLNLIFFASAMPMETAVERYTQPLKDTATLIAEALEESPDSASQILSEVSEEDQSHI